MWFNFNYILLFFFGRKRASGASAQGCSLQACKLASLATERRNSQLSTPRTHGPQLRLSS